MSQYPQPDSRKNISTSKSSTEHALLQYRNGFYQGHIDEYSQRQGKGAYLWNTGEIYYGEWNQDRMEGEGIFYFALGGYVYGTFLDDRVHGYAVLCFSNGDYSAGFWERGVLNGKVVQHSKVDNDWALDEYRDGIPIRILMKGKGAPPLDTFTMLETYSIKKLIEKESTLFIPEKANNEKIDRPHLDFLPIDPDGWFHGNIQTNGPHGLGIVCYSEHKSDRGLFKDGALSSLGRSLFSNGDVYDGFYKDGKFHGIGVYFKSETEQYLYGMYESNECVQALTLGNGYPHELMRTLKADFHLESAEYIDKETEPEVLTLSFNEQIPPQEQEDYEDISKQDKKRKEEDERNRNSISQVQDSQFSEQSQKSYKRGDLKKETDTRSSVSSKKSKPKSKKGTNQDLDNVSNLSIKDKGTGSRKTFQEEEVTSNKTKNLEKSKLKYSASSQASDSRSELFVSRKSIQASDPGERKGTSKGNLDNAHKTSEKVVYGQSYVKDAELEKLITEGKTNSSYGGSPARDSIYKTENSEVKDHLDNSVPYHVRTSGLVEKASLKALTYEPRVANRFPTDFSDRSTSFNADKSVVQPQSYDFKSYQLLSDNTMADRSMEIKTDVNSYAIDAPKSSFNYTANQVETPQPSYSYIANQEPKSSYNYSVNQAEIPQPSYNYTANLQPEVTYNYTVNQVETPQPSYGYIGNQENNITTTTTTDIYDGLDSHVKKIMDRIFLQHPPPPEFNLPLSSTIEIGLTPTESYLFNTIDKPVSLDRSPTFAQVNNEYNQAFDYTHSNNSLGSGSYSGTAALNQEARDRRGSDNLSMDWNLKIFPSLDSSLTRAKEYNKTSQVTGSFGLIPNAPSEDSLSSKIHYDQNKLSQTSNTFLSEIDLRERAVSGRFGGYEGTNPAIVPEVARSDYYGGETTYKNYKFTGDNQISTSHGDIDTKSFLKVKTPVNKKVEHSPAPNMATDHPYLEYSRAYEVNVDKSYEDHVKSSYLLPVHSEVPSGRGSIVTKTDTWSAAYTVQKNLEPGSMISSEKPGDMTTSQILRKFGIEKSHVDLNSKSPSLKDVPSEILDIGSVSNRQSYLYMNNLEKKVPETPVYQIPADIRPTITISTPEKDLSNAKLEEELYKIILLKLEILVKEQNKAAEAADEIKRNLNDKLEALFREERRENENFKIILNHKLDSLFKERTYDLSREQLNQIHQDLTSSNKQISSSFCGVNKKLDLLLLRQGRLTVETEDNLVNKLDTTINKSSKQSSASVNVNSIPISYVKSVEGGDNLRSEILIANSSGEYNSTQKGQRKESVTLKQTVTASPNVMIRDYSRDTDRKDIELSKSSKVEFNNNSRHSSIKDQRNSIEQKLYRNSEKDQIEAKRRAQADQSKKVEHDLSNISDDATEYASVASDSAPAKTVRSIQPKSKEFSMKNEHTINLLQYESELRYMNSQEKQYRTPQKSDKEALGTPKHLAPLPRSLTPTPQSRGPTEIFQPMRSPGPAGTSHNASMVMDSQPGTHRQSRLEFAARSPVATGQQQTTKYGNSEKKSIYKFPEAPPNQNNAQWHVVPLCAQDSLFDEPEEVVEEHTDYQAYEERKAQGMKSPGNMAGKKNSFVQNHNRANSISSQSSFNVFDLKGFQRPIGAKPAEGSQKKSNTRGSLEYQGRVGQKNAQSVFDNFVVTSNNNDIQAAEYVRIEKNKSVSFMNRDFAYPGGPKFANSAKKAAVQTSTVDLYEDEGEQERNKKKRGSKDLYGYRNDEGYERYSYGNNELGHLQVSPVRRDNYSPNRVPKTVYQEGRLGNMKWRLEIEDMANDTERSQGNQYESEDYERNMVYEKKMKSMSVMSSPINQRREFEHLMSTVNPAKDIGTYEHNMFSNGKYESGDVMTSGGKGYRQTEVKVPGLALGGDVATNRAKKQKPYNYRDLSISHIDKDLKY